MSESYQVAVLRDRTEMLEAQLDDARKKIHDLEQDNKTTEKTLMMQAARRFSTADISLKVDRTHNRKPDEPLGEVEFYELSINGAVSPIKLSGTTLDDIAKLLDEKLCVYNDR